MKSMGRDGAGGGDGGEAGLGRGGIIVYRVGILEERQHTARILIFGIFCTVCGSQTDLGGWGGGSTADGGRGEITTHSVGGKSHMKVTNGTSLCGRHLGAS